MRDVRIWIICLVVVLTMGIAGCQPFLRGGGKLSGERTVVLAIPLSGTHAAVGAKIQQGARAAEQDLTAHGVMMRLHFFDTQKPDWTTRLAQLPEECVVIGGPLDLTAYKTARKAGLVQSRAFFAFLNNLDGKDEGTVAWRFFPSPQDQIDTLLNFTTDELQIRSYGAFYPTDTYSQKMVALFEKSVQQRNLPLQKASYNGSMPSSWSQSARTLINPTIEREGANTIAIPRTSFEAVFLPASWKHMDNLIASFMYNGEDRLVLMGTMGWEPSLAGRRLNRADRFELTMFPSAWNSQVSLPALKDIKKDFWVSLGFDFVNFAANLGLTRKPTSPDLIERMNRASGSLRLLAPLSWDTQGIAHQKMFLYRATDHGIVRIDARSFSALRTARKQKAALRLQGGLIQESVTPRTSVPAAAVSQPTDENIPKAQKVALPPSSPVISTPVPHTSYKLRLPTKAVQSTPVAP